MKIKSLVAAVCAAVSMSAFAGTVVVEQGTIYDQPGKPNMTQRTLGYIQGINDSVDGYVAMVTQKDDAAGTTFGQNIEAGGIYKYRLTKNFGLAATGSVGQKDIPGKDFTYWAFEPAITANFGQAYGMVGYRFRQAFDNNASTSFYKTEYIRATVGYNLPYNISAYYRFEDSQSGPKARANFVGVTKSF